MAVAISPLRNAHAAHSPQSGSLISLIAPSDFHYVCRADFLRHWCGKATRESGLARGSPRLARRILVRQQSAIASEMKTNSRAGRIFFTLLAHRERNRSRRG
jgi:hypothetical protein